MTLKKLKMLLNNYGEEFDKHKVILPTEKDKDFRELADLNIGMLSKSDKSYIYYPHIDDENYEETNTICLWPSWP